MDRRRWMLWGLAVSPTSCQVAYVLNAGKEVWDLMHFKCIWRKSCHNMLHFLETRAPTRSACLPVSAPLDVGDAALCILNQGSTEKQASMWQQPIQIHLPLPLFFPFRSEGVSCLFYPSSGCGALLLMHSCLMLSNLLEELRCLRVTHNWMG